MMLRSLLFYFINLVVVAGVVLVVNVY